MALTDAVSHVWTRFRYYSHDYWNEVADPRTKDFPLMSDGPEMMLSIMAFYFIMVTRIGPAFMKNRPAYVLREPMLVYNMFMVVCNTIFFYYIVISIDYGRRFLNFKFPDPNDFSPSVLTEIRMGYLCYLTRFADLFDTVFFVLRKKNNQITFLHLYHHTLVPILGWMSVKIAPQAPVIALFLMFNTLIHAIMYLYYSLAAFGPAIQKYLWWKRYLTQLQLVQFACCGIYGVAMVFLEEGFPKGLFWVGFAQNPIFFYMFYDFYKKAYNKNKAAALEAGKKKAQ